MMRIAGIAGKNPPSPLCLAAEKKNNGALPWVGTDEQPRPADVSERWSRGAIPDKHHQMGDARRREAAARLESEVVFPR
ncbi:hypothetical protein L2E82_45477 [Cichorium intybus]|uniref:Uncharacterized protein n=1 Tax=Cichorium intybus TaxID=13427 RepID=A0ACB8ZTF0_CICIN|nr:hypothetical protein L2E82_45477 [Cichorium intybus]